MRIDDRPTRRSTSIVPTSSRGRRSSTSASLGNVANYIYDDYQAIYDDPLVQYTYDDGQSWPYDRMELFCRFHGVRIESGTVDAEGSFDAGHVEMTLDNRDGELSQYDALGRLVDFAPGSALDIWAELDGADWWLFSGRVTAWRERADGTIEVEAFDVFADLNRHVGGEWDPGDYGDLPGERMTKIVAAAGYTGPTRFDVGDVTLHSYVTDASPLEELAAVALSDGGFLVVDADGTIVYVDRDWIAGRDDQTDVPTMSDNYCDAPLIVWDPDVTTDDDVLVNIVQLRNVADVVAERRDNASVYRHGPRALPSPHSDDQWMTIAEGEALADYLIARRSDHYLRVESFALYLHDARVDLWAVGIDRRLGDLVTWIHEQPAVDGAALIVLVVAVQQITHEITPETWVTTLATTRTISNRVPVRYDETTFTYDDADPRNVYAF